MSLAFIFSDVGAGEWFILLAVVLVVMGPKRLPGAARKFGSYYAKFRRAADTFRRQLLEMDTEIDNAIASAEREASAAFTVEEGADGAAGVGESHDGATDDYGHDYGDFGDAPPGDYGYGEAAPGPEPAPAPEPAAKKPRDLSAIKVTVSPAPGAKSGGAAEA